MIENLLKCLNGRKVITDNLEKIIDVFVMFYGEDKRDYIEAKFKNTIILTSSDPSSIKRIISELKQVYTTALEKKCLNELNISVEDDTLEKIFGLFSLDNNFLIPIDSYGKYLENLSTGVENKPYNFE